MARYDDRFGQSPRTRKDIRGNRPRGMDPNYQGGTYSGERLRTEGQGDAPYGWYRLHHAQDLGGQDAHTNRQGGYGQEFRGGRHPTDRTPPGYGYDRGYRNLRGPRGPYDGGYPRSGPHGVPNDMRYLHDFNANSPAFREGGEPQGWRGGNLSDASPRGRGRIDASRGLRYDEGFNEYGGYNQSGFAEVVRPKQANRGSVMPHGGYGRNQ